MGACSVLPYQRPCASRSTSTRRCTTTGTSSRRSPSAASASTLPYEEQVDVGDRPRSSREQLAAGVDRDPLASRTSSPPSRTRAPSRRSAPGTRQGHFIHITCTARATRTPQTAAVAGADRPALRRALLLLRQGHPLRGDRDRRADRRLAGRTCGARSTPGSRAATLVHPWNRELVRDRGRDLRPRLAGRSRAAPRAGAGMTRAERAPAPPATRPARYLPAIEPERQLDRLGPLGAGRGLLRPDARRVLLPLLVPGRGRGDRERARRRRRAAGLQPRRARCRRTRR